MTSPAWMADAECRGTSPALFFPDQGKNLPAEARAMCANCPVREPCLDYALANNITEGCWGGYTEKDRRSIRRRRQRAANREQVA